MRSLNCDLIIIGGGPGGYVAAIRASQLGARVLVIEKDQLGGTCLNRGCIPTKALHRSAEVFGLLKEVETFGLARLDCLGGRPPGVFEHALSVAERLRRGIGTLLKSHGVDVIHGTAQIEAAGRVRVANSDGRESEFETAQIIIATGSEPIFPPIRGLEHAAALGTSLELKGELPESAVIIGGGIIGLEYASIFAALEVEVSVVELLPSVLPMFDQDVVRRFTLALKKRGVKLLTEARVTEIAPGDGGLEVTVVTAEGDQTLVTERVYLATGRRPFFGGLDLDRLGIQYDRRGIMVNEYLETSVSGILAVGDCIGEPLLAHVASMEGIVAAENLFGRKRPIDYRAVPNCVFTFPELASVGHTEASAAEAGIGVRTGRFNFAANGKAMALGETDGLVKLVAEAASGRIIGGQVMGPHASDLIAEIALAVNHGLTAEQIAGTIHAHPTLPEAVAEAAEDILGHAIHQTRPTRR